MGAAFPTQNTLLYPMFVSIPNDSFFLILSMKPSVITGAHPDLFLLHLESILHSLVFNYSPTTSST